MDDPYRSPEAKLVDGGEAEDLALAIGPNADFYLKYVDRHARSRWFVSWNWPAFFVAPAWLLYRKRFLLFFLFAVIGPFVIQPGLLALAVLLLDSPNAVVILAVMVGPTLLLPLALSMFANALYIDAMTRLVRRENANALDPELARAAMAKKGGISTGWMLFGLFYTLILTLGTSAR